MNTTDTINYKSKGFDNNKYLSTQKDKILERIDHFRDGKLYLEIGGKFLHDPHASRTLPGFEPDVKKKIFHSMRSMSDLFFCINAQDIRTNRQLKNSDEKYTDSVIAMADQLHRELGIKPKIVINLCDRKQKEMVTTFEHTLNTLTYETYKRYKIDGYPHSDNILSDQGYGYDDYIPTNKKLILVVGAASNSGKMSTCLGQIYNDKIRGITSGYAKYETFPIWSLPLNHPVNLAYEAATADIGDYNVIDTYHEQAYGKRSVNYNRDVEAFEIIMNLASKFLDDSNYMTTYKSPTDMGINYAGNGITNDEVVCIASLNEIRRRREWYQQVVDRGNGSKEWLRKCDSLENPALKYIREQGYNPELRID